MAQHFHLKLITERAGGGAPIVRERTVEAAEAAIGRAAESDIVLSDLAVDPQHAKMRITGPGRVSIESVGGLPIEVNGKRTQRADLSVANRPVLGIGSYSLALEPGDGESVVVTVTREEEEEHLSPSVFSLQSRVFGRRKMAWVFGTGIFLVCLIVPLVATLWFTQTRMIHPDQQWSSGPLTKAHAFLETNCKACHANAFVAVRDNACMSCHQAGSAEGLARARQLGSPFRPLQVKDHAPRNDPKRGDVFGRGVPEPDNFGARISLAVQRAFGHPTDRCGSCHIEHTKLPEKGKPTPAAPPSDKPALLTVNTCESCHTASLKDRVRDTDLLPAPTWADHPRFRPLVMTAAAPTPQFQRVALSAAPKERNGLIFPHDMHLDPAGGVARQAIELGGRYGKPLECASCHEAVGTGFKPIEMERACGDCHSLAYARGADGRLLFLPHGEPERVLAMLDGRALTAPGGSGRTRPGTIAPSLVGPGMASAYRAAMSPGGTCSLCHTIRWDGDVAKVTPVALTQRYMPRGAFDHSIAEHGALGKTGKAGSFKCADCHQARTSKATGDVLVPDLGKCATCHGKTTAQIAAADDGDCTTCHAFHKPGGVTPKPGHPPLQTLRWTQATSRRPGA